MTHAGCPRCGAFLAADAQITDGPNGIVVVVDQAVATERRHCICGQFTWTIASTTTSIRQPQLTLIQGAA